MTTNLDYLESLAKAATPGPWRTSRKYGEHDDIVRTEWSTQSKKARDVLIGGACAFGRDHRGHIRIIEAIGPQWEANAAYIAAVSPDVVLELIAEIRKLRAELEYLGELHTEATVALRNKEIDTMLADNELSWLEAAREAVEKEANE